MVVPFTEMGDGGEEEPVSKLTTDTGLLCQHHPPGQGLGDWLRAAHPEKWAEAGDPSWGKKGAGELQVKGTFLGGASQRGGDQRLPFMTRVTCPFPGSLCHLLSTENDLIRIFSLNLLQPEPAEGRGGKMNFMISLTAQRSLMKFQYCLFDICLIH